MRLKTKIFIPALAFFTAAFLVCLTTLEFKYEHDLQQGREQAAAHLAAYNQTLVKKQSWDSAGMASPAASAYQEHTPGAYLLHSEIFTVQPAMVLRADGTVVKLQPGPEQLLSQLWDQQAAAAVLASSSSAEVTAGQADGKTPAARAVNKVKAQYLRLDERQALLRFVPADGN
ncbi:MAG: hypothetical protein IAB19_08260 [Proteobacteria bacterium]|uniref:Uncharacterized protein n=1 Tax=Candidatus Avisuccinivibrio stercorigallinarum TaxID=2840704 RepID=A0A9D9DFB9_9GAMM|nr:hypothetical protein [Candidatus Avisuccinivibrio stercorigallinarum]